MQNNMKRIIYGIILILLGVLSGYLIYGFFYPDPFYLSQMSLMYNLVFLWGPPALILLFYIALLLVFFTWKKKVSGNFFLFVASILILSLLIYPVADYMYYKRQVNRIVSGQNDMHAILQVKPGKNQDQLAEFKSEDFNIFCFGGSTTAFPDKEGIGWPDRLEEILSNGNNDMSVSVYNLGNPWYTTLHTLINYQTNARKYKPDLIIVMHAINDLLINADFSHLSKGEYRDDYGHFYGPIAFVNKSRGLFGMISGTLKSMWNHKPRQIIEQEDFPGLVAFKRNLSTLIDLAQQDSTMVIILSQPNIYTENMPDDVKKVCRMVNFEAVGENKQWSYETALTGMNTYNQLAWEIAQNRGIYFFDLEKVIPKDLDHFIDEVHYKEDGDAFDKIADALGNYILEQNIINDKAE